MRVIITGGTGLIGSALSADLAKAGHEVIVLSRSPEKHQSGLPAGVKAVAWDGRTAAGWGSLADGAGAIVNLAGENLSAGRWSEARKERIRSSRLNAGQAIVQAVQAATVKPGVVIQSSAVGYYGPRGDEPIPETTPPGNDFLARLCVEWEQSTQAVEALGVRRAITRFGVVLSPAGGVLPLFRLPFTFFVGGPLGSGRQAFPWIHIADVVAAIRFLIETPTASGPFNVDSPNPLTMRQFAQAFGQAMGRPAFMPVPPFALKLLFGEMSTVMLDGQRQVPARLNEAGFKFRFPEAVPALRNLLGKA